MAKPRPCSSTQQRRSGLALGLARQWGKRAQALLVLGAIVALLGIASPHFLSADNLLNVMQQSAINAILGIGLTFVIISAGIDLSVGSLLALSGLITADLLVHGVPTPVAALAGVGIGDGPGRGQRAGHHLGAGSRRSSPPWA